MRTEPGSEEALVHKIGRVFGPLFGEGIPLDIMFVTTEQELRLAKICRPFFDAAEAAQ